MRTSLCLLFTMGLPFASIAQSNVGTVRNGSDKAQGMFDKGFREKDPLVDSTAIFCGPPNVAMPEFPGGKDSLTAYVSRSFNYPTGVGLDTLNGKIYVEFAVDERGQSMDVRTKRGLHPLLDAEAERVILEMPRWRPGTENGKPKKMRFMLPITVRPK